MFFRPTLAVAGFAALSSAFLLPPTTASDDTDAITTLPFDVLINSDRQSVSLDCAGCAVPVGRTVDGLTLLMDGLASTLQLDFEINHLKSSDVLTLNGVQLFPVDSETRIEPLRAAQVLQASKDDNEAASDRVEVGLGYESRIHTIKAADEVEPLSLYSVRIQILEVGGQWIDGLEAIEMKLIVTPAGGLMIADLAKTATTNSALEAGVECTTVLCKLRKALNGQVSHSIPKMKGKPCGGKVKGMPNDRPRIGGKPHREHGFRPHGHGSHRHRHHNRLHRFLHALKNVALQVLIPVFIGIACGIAASFIGMVVGHAVVFLWRHLYRHGQAGQQLEVQSESKSEKAKLLLEHEDVPPAYTDDATVLVDEKVVEL